jgi:hypothetical protein
VKTQVPGVCVPGATQNCTASHGTGKQACDDAGQAWSTCAPSSCEIGYLVESGACVEVSGLAFNPIFRANAAFLALPGTYSYEPSAMLDDDQTQKVWWCGHNTAASYGDSIYYAQLGSAGDVLQAPVEVLHPTALDSSPDARHNCSPGVIRHADPGIQDGAPLYLLYYECGPRLYDRNPANNGNAVEGFTQICLAFSIDGVSWQRYNAQTWSGGIGSGVDTSTIPSPVVAVAPRVLNNCAYQLEANGEQTIDTSLASCSGINVINNYGSGHPSAVVIAGQIWLYYYDSRGDWTDHGVYVVTSLDGIHFASAAKSDLPTDASVRYEPWGGGGGGLFLAPTVIGASNVLFYSWDGLHFVPASGDGLAVRQAVSGHCAAPGPGSIVGDPYGNVSSLQISFLSAEGFLGTADNGQALGCYSSQEDTARGSTWQIYLVSGQLQPLSDATILPSETFEVRSDAAIYATNGAGHFCSFATWGDFVRFGGTVATTASVADIPNAMINDGNCVVP